MFGGFRIVAFLCQPAGYFMRGFRGGQGGPGAAREGDRVVDIAEIPGGAGLENSGAGKGTVGEVGPLRGGGVAFGRLRAECANRFFIALPQQQGFLRGFRIV